MFRLRLTLAVLVAVAVTVGGLLGQAKDPEVTKKRLPTNWKKLGLSDEQLQMVYKTTAKYDSQIVQLKQQITQLQKEEKAELDKILTKPQKDRLREILLGEKPTDKDTPKDKDTDKD